QAPIASASAASPSQLANHNCLDGKRLEIRALESALTPIKIPPHPGTAVKYPARSMVSRMYLRFSSARWLMDTTLAVFMPAKVTALDTDMSSTLHHKDRWPCLMPVVTLSSLPSESSWREFR